MINQRIQSKVAASSKQRHNSLINKASHRRALLPTTENVAKIEFSPTGTYDDKTDLNVVHGHVLNSFKKKKDQIPSLELQKTALEREFIKPMYTIVERNVMFGKITKIAEQIKQSGSAEDQEEYLERTSRILFEWKKIHEMSNQKVFGVAENFSPELLSLVRVFIQIASQYCPDLDMTLGVKNKPNACPYCRNEYTQSETEKIICETCNIYQANLHVNVTYGDIDRINSSNVNNYHNEENFDKAIDVLRGNVEAVYPKDFFKLCDDYCERKELSKSALLPETARIMFKELNYTNYDVVHLFLYQYIDRPLLNFEELIPRIKQDNKRFSQAYEKVKECRDSALNAQLVLYLLLRRIKFPCRRGDFKIPNTLEILRSSERNARRAFELLGWPYIDLS